MNYLFSFISMFVMHQDEGVYEYINDSTFEVQRSTQLLDKDTILSADQADVVQQAAVQQINRAAASSSQAIRISNDQPDCHGGEPDFVGASGGEEDGSDEDMLDPKPFASALSRLMMSHGSLGAKRAAPKAAVEPSTKKAKGPEKAPGLSTPTPARTRNRKTTDVKAENAPKKVKSSAALDEGDGEMAEEDADMIATFTAQIKDVGSLNIEAGQGLDDAGFSQWAKTQLSQINTEEFFANQKEVDQSSEIRIMCRASGIDSRAVGPIGNHHGVCEEPELGQQWTFCGWET